MSHTGAMTNPERNPKEVWCEAGVGREVTVLAPREVPLGGPRAMSVRRTLPSRERSLIGAWCFVDHYGPDAVADSGGMSVAPHPHTGLQTVSWLFTGEIEHRDSAQHHAMVRPGEVNLMTAGRGISHSEVSTASTTTLHGVQLWVALPDADRHIDPMFAHHTPSPIQSDQMVARVFLGSLLGETSPVSTLTPLLGAELVLEPGAKVELEVDPGFEHGVLLDTVAMTVAGHQAQPGDLVYLPTGCSRLRLEAADGPARVLLLGGEPFGESIVMWWNFVGRSHEEIVEFRREWQAQIHGDEAGASGSVVDDSQDVAQGRFGVVIDDHLPPIPAPELPNVRLRERR